MGRLCAGRAAPGASTGRGWGLSAAGGARNRLVPLYPRRPRPESGSLLPEQVTCAPCEARTSATAGDLPVLGPIDSLGDVVSAIFSHSGPPAPNTGPFIQVPLGFCFIPLLPLLPGNLFGRPRISLRLRGPFTSTVRSRVHLCRLCPESQTLRVVCTFNL